MLHLLPLLWSRDWQHATYCCSFTVCPGIFIPAVSLLYSPSCWNTPARELLESFMQCNTFPRVETTCIFYRVCYVPVLQYSLPTLCLRHASPVCSVRASESLAPGISSTQSRKSSKGGSFGSLRNISEQTIFTCLYCKAGLKHTEEAQSESSMLWLVLNLNKGIIPKLRINFIERHIYWKINYSVK